MLPASALPVIIGVLSLLGEELVNEVGGFGAVASIDKDREEEGDILPAKSVAVAVRE